MSSSSSSSSDEDEGDERRRRALRDRRKLMRRLQAAEEDNSTDIALVVVLCTMVVLLLIGSAFVMQGESDFFSSNQQGNRHNNRRRRARSRRRQQVNPTVVDLSFSLNDLYTGTKRAFKVQRQVVCPSLRTGDAPSRAHCETAVELCRHRQVKTQAQRDFFSGRVDRTFYCQFMARIHATIPPGTRHGDTIEVEGAGNLRPGMRPGNVVVRVVELSNRIFQREGDDLVHKVSLSLREALLGWSREVEHLDGRTVTISSASRGPGEAVTTTAAGEVVVVKGEGMTRKDGGRGGGWFSSSPEQGRGDLRVVVDVKFPRMKRLPRELRKDVARLFD